ncbi:MAG: hypothetical protein K6C30_06205 [Bacteroidaceae bacterium]|nr:hypothetical protein [Bacteroidaceae bacterium]
MFTYQQNKSTECLPCVAETFKALTQDPETARKIDDVRRLNACGNVAEAKKRKDSLPGCLYQTREVLESIGEAKYNQGKKGRWRLQSQCVLNGLVMCDFDHVESEELRVKSEEFAAADFSQKAQEMGIVLVFITPSGEGLKVVFIADINYNLTDNQKMMAKQLGLTAKIDKGTKDSSRLSYIPKWDDILYMDEEKLFNYDNPLYDEKYGKQYREGNSQGRLDFAEDTAGKTDQAAELTEDLSAINLDENEDGVYCYHGVPYTDILKKWLELTGGTPDIGDRHDRMLGLSGELRRIMNNKPANVLWLMKQADFYEEFVKEGREKELERMAVDVCKFRPRGAMSEELAQTLDSFGIKYTKLEVQNNLPYDDWADRLLALPLGCYEAALAHVDNPRVKPGAVITASGMYSVLLTRCDYQNWKGDMQRLNSLVLMCGEPASGKAVAKEQDEHIMLTMRESDKPARQAEKAYKKEKNARNTSSKAQKGEALQEPGGIIRYNVVKVSNNRFYKHAENNKETGYDGQQWFLHQYMFSTELLSLINAKGGFQEKRDIMLQAFHNERNSVDYANSDSVNDSMPMMFSGVFTCTRTSLQQFINARNIGDGLSTRMTPWVMPEEDYHTDEYRASRRDKTPAHLMEEWGARFDALKCEIKGLERLVRHVYDLCAALGEEARINEDKVLNLERKRLQDKVMAVCIPQVISTQPSWEEFVKTGVCQIEQHHLDFADLMCEIINRCEDALFGQLLQDMYDNEARDTQLRRVYDKTAKFYSMLPDEFTTQDVQRVWGYKSNVAASSKCNQFIKECIIEKLERGHFRKLANAI